LATPNLLKGRWRRLRLSVAFGLFLTVTPGLSWPGQNSCEDVLARGYLSVMSLNMLYGDFEGLNARLKIVADYIAQQDKIGEPVDLILLQEVAGGALAQTEDSSRQLQTILSLQGLRYNHSSRFYLGQRCLFRVPEALTYSIPTFVLTASLRSGCLRLRCSWNLLETFNAFHGGSRAPLSWPVILTLI
jgi:hypothetical protein